MNSKDWLSFLASLAVTCAVLVAIVYAAYVVLAVAGLAVLWFGFDIRGLLKAEKAGRYDENGRLVK